MLNIFLILLLKPFTYCSQNSEDNFQKTTRLTIKAGIGINGTTGNDFYGDLNFVQSHGIVNPSYNVIHTYLLNYNAPYISVGFSAKMSKSFGLYIGGAYTQTSNEFSYSGFDYYNFNGNHYTESHTNGKGKVVNSIFRIEFTPTFYIHHTKIAIGLINADKVFSDLKVTPVTSTYDVTGKMHNTGDDLPADSIVTFTGMHTDDPIHKRNDGFHLPLTLGLEQEFRLKSGFILLGAKGIYSRLGTYYGLIFYTGYIFGKKKD